MKSILLTSSNSPSNNISVVVGSNANTTNIHRKRVSELRGDDNDSAVETLDQEQFNNKLLNHSRIKKQVIKNKIVAKNDDKIKRASSDKIYSEDQRYIKSKNIISNNNSDSESNLEDHPLIAKSKNSNADESYAVNGRATGKLINLRKKNGTTLIFQRKSYTAHLNNKSQQPVSANENQELQIESLKKRQSLQWPNNVTVNNKFDKNKVRHSWYDSRNTEEDFENSPLTQFANENNLAEIKTASKSSAGEENVPDNTTMKTTTKDNNTVTGAPGTTSKRWRLEQFLKSLVGKRSSAVTIPVQNVKKSPSAYDLLQQKPSLCGSATSLNKDRLINKSTTSLNSTSLALVHHKLWSVVPLLNRRDGGGGGASCNNLLAHENVLHGGKMRKCETVLALTDEPVASTSSNRNYSKSINSLLEPLPIRPLNRLRNSQSCYVNFNPNAIHRQPQNCSRCSSLLSLAAIDGSSYSLTNGAFVVKNGKQVKRHVNATLLDEDLCTIDVSSNRNLISSDFNKIESYDTSVKLALTKGQQNLNTTKFTCKLCLGEFFNEDKLTTITSCGCTFCTECMRAYVEFEISEGAYELSCPDALCSTQGVVSLAEISQLANASLVAKHHRYRLNREVELDKYRLWCPNRNCETICSVIPNEPKLSPSTSSQSAIQQQPSSSTATLLLPRSVLCPTCNLEFCSSCKKAWHQSITCEENSRRLGSRNDSIMLFDNDLIKNCPMCAVPIEKDEGCAQMMCKRCKHVFCWYCLASLDEDFLLRHYDKGPCKNKLGHSRASVVWHRAQVIGIFAGFGILLLVASPLLLLAAPCIVCCKCKIEESTQTAKLDDVAESGDHQV